MPSTLGSETRLVFFEEPVPGNIHLEFEAGAAIKKGQQVKLEAATGKVIPLADGDNARLCIGVAIMDIASDERGTIATRGSCVILARAGAAINAGPCEIEAYDSSNDRPVYSNTSTDGLVVGWNLTFLGAAGEIKMLLV